MIKIMLPGRALWRRALTGLLTLTLMALPLGCARAANAAAATAAPTPSAMPTLSAAPPPTDGQAPNAASAAPTTPPTEPYEAKTELVTAEFQAQPHIDVYNYMLGDSVCQLIKYELESGEKEENLYALTFPDELSASIAAMDYDGRLSILHMALAVMENEGIILSTQEPVKLFSMPCYMFSADTNTTEYVGWATMDVKQAIFAFASADDEGYDFLGTIKTNRDAKFTVDGNTVSFQNATLNFPGAARVENGTATSQSADTCERAQLIQLPDMAALMPDEDDDTVKLLLQDYLPAGATDVNLQKLSDTRTLTYSYDDAALKRPIQGRLILLEGYILRMEATFDNAGDEFMNGARLS